jgi:predicted ATPase/class 3 adenylate cyclase
LLFSDIEGSTLMLNRLGDRWGEALSAQRSILRAVWAAHDGHEMGTEGDSFFVVFGSTQRALAAAVEGQRRLQGHDWPDGVALRVRMGLHTGEPQRHEDGYIGIDVHRAARISATASGGQIVLSSSTRALLGHLPERIVLRDLGRHRLKDLAEPEQLYDVEVPGLLSEFPPLRSLGTRANLPTYSTPLVGRQSELGELHQLIGERRARLVTLTGPGGTGKTRLAVEMAVQLQDDFPCDTFFVDLHAADRAALMWSGIADGVGAVAESDQLPHERALRFLSDHQSLLILDNLEQVDDADVVVSQLLSDAPQVRVVATSRRPLHLVDEQEYPVSTLAVPERGESRVSAAESGAVALFVRRAAMVRPRFALTDDNVDDVVALCRRLDGLPLALELAAARCRFLSPRALLSRIDERLGVGVTASDRAERQRTLGATIAWSYDLLSPSDQRTFRRLGVFSSRVDLSAIAEIAASDADDPLDAVAHLVDVSLVQVVEAPDGEPMITLLETIRHFARERLLESGECEEIQTRHALWCLQAATEARDLLHGPHQTLALDRINAIEEDIRAALDLCLQTGEASSQERRECGLALLAVMSTYWYRFGYAAEGRGWTTRGLGILESTDEPDSARFVDTLHGAAILGLQQSDLGPSTAALERALEMARRLGDVGREARESNSLGIARREAGDVEAARRLIERSIRLARETADREREATALTNMVPLCLDIEDYQAAVEAARSALSLDKQLGDPWGIAISESNMVTALLMADGPEPAYRHLREIAPSAIALYDIELSIVVLETAAMALAALDEPETAATILGATESLRTNAGMPRAAPDQRHLDRFIEPARRSFGEQKWRVAEAAGTGLNVEQTLALALSYESAPAVGSR